ncbi:ABC transporter permease [Rhabdobacter roseus]|uniref:Putative ABC transport system permease protein n=1 Tax=Rhabdobacter roseus TaxID=1655419 RepID=A0A840TV95_9BACT|nr:ABC transporter permease [Rhabdobacter roseus]MBB5285557.1 putative ABC transport system permease protein [Rhabdobacter roseus]
MLINDFKIAKRSLLKHKLFSFINVFGLALGVACSLFIGLWVLDELSFDRFLPNADRIYRLESTTITPDGTQMKLPAVGWPVGKVLQADYPEVEQVTYLRGWSPQLKHQETYIREAGLAADQNFLTVLGYELAQGDPATALAEPFSVILSPAAEAKYFGKGNGLGKVLMVNDTLPHRVTGVFKEVPTNGHLRFDLVQSLASLHALYPEDMVYEYASGWFDLNVANYLLLKPGTDVNAFSAKIKDLVGQRGKAMVEQTGMSSTLQLRPLTDIYLRSGMPTEDGPLGNIDSIYLFIAIGLFVLLIACLNVINLTTARATERAKEVGIKKVLGVQKKQLIQQFLTEAAIVCITATALGLGVTLVLLPQFSAFTGKSFGYGDLLGIEGLLLIVAFLATIIPLTGVYPAWVLTAYQPISVLKGRFARSARGVLLRKGLVVAQFAASVCLIICTVAAWQQVRFMQQQPLGFDQQNILTVDLSGVSSRNRSALAATLRSELLTHSQITAATAANAVPGQMGWDGQFAYGEGNAPGKGILVEHIPVDQHYTRTLNLRLLAGRDFVADSKADEAETFLINEAAVNAFGWENPPAAIGKKLSVSGINGKVVGVVRNYHQHSLHDNIRPLVLNAMPRARVVAFRYEGNNPTAAINHLKASWEKLFPGYVLDFNFLDAAFKQQYLAEQKLIDIFSLAAGMAILISCLGLLGLSVFSTIQRQKEIGVRKVLGASVASIVALLSKDFLKLVLIAILIASPIAWYAMKEWLADFAYKVDINWWVFALAGGLAVGIALLTVSFQSVKAALMNPVKSLRSE